MLITDSIFFAFLRCEIKADLLYKKEVGIQSSFIEEREHSFKAYKQKCSILLQEMSSKDKCFIGNLPLQEFKKYTYKYVFDCLLEAKNLRSYTHVLEYFPSSNKTDNHYISIRFVPQEKIKKYDKILLAFDAFVLMANGWEPKYGIIIHGSNPKRTKVKLMILMKTVRSIIERIETQITQNVSLKPILKKHCSECEFQKLCRAKAIQNDDLSLLRGMTVVERKGFVA